MTSFRLWFSEWKKISIGFEEFHHDAQAVVDKPFLWSWANDFDPNGNASRPKPIFLRIGNRTATLTP